MVVLVIMHKANAAGLAIIAAQNASLNNGTVDGKPLKQSGIVSVGWQIAHIQIRIGDGLGARTSEADLTEREKKKQASKERKIRN